MKGLLFAAVKFEIEPCIKALKRNTDWQVVITGVGGVSTAYSVAKAIEKYKPNVMIQAGIAGSFNKQFNLGDVVIVGSDCFGDLGVIENKKHKSLFDMNFLSADEKPFRNGRLVNPHKKMLNILLLPVVNAVSVNEITTSKVDIEYFRNELRISIESMEGAAFHYVASMEKIPFLQIRSISNYVGVRDKGRWKVEKAISNLTREVVQIIENLNRK